MRPLVLVGLLAFAAPALADNFLVATDNPPTPVAFNTVNLFMSSPGAFGNATPSFALPAAPWVQITPSGGASMQLQTSDLSTSTLFAWNQAFIGVGASYQISYTVGFFDGVSFTMGYGGNATLLANQPGLIAPTPEPSSVLVCGLALGVTGVRAWRRRRAVGAGDPS